MLLTVLRIGAFIMWHRKPKKLKAAPVFDEGLVLARQNRDRINAIQDVLSEGNVLVVKDKK